ncbi:MAG: hypothetical protein Q9169_001710 [Polycauliona sp. 2 TL-2023]
MKDIPPARKVFHVINTLGHAVNDGAILPVHVLLVDTAFCFILQHGNGDLQDRKSQLKGFARTVRQAQHLSDEARAHAQWLVRMLYDNPEWHPRNKEWHKSSPPGQPRALDNQAQRDQAYAESRNEATHYGLSTHILDPAPDPQPQALETFNSGMDIINNSLNRLLGPRTSQPSNQALLEMLLPHQDAQTQSSASPQSGRPVEANFNSSLSGNISAQQALQAHDPQAQGIPISEMPADTNINSGLPGNTSAQQPLQAHDPGIVPQTKTIPDSTSSQLPKLIPSPPPVVPDRPDRINSCSGRTYAVTAVKTDRYLQCLIKNNLIRMGITQLNEFQRIILGTTVPWTV